MSAPKKGIIHFLQEYSIPLIVGVVAALVVANVDYDTYHHIVDWDLGFSIFGHHVTPHFIINDIFMVLFFGIAAKEITESVLPGGSLNPMKKALNPLISTLGGVFGPVAFFFGVLYLSHGLDLFPDKDISVTQRGWGIPTATDIALAWLVSRTVFGPGHPAINFLLLLAVADDALGLVIIAVFYGDPANPAKPEWLLLALVGMALAFALRRIKVQSWKPYILVAGPLAWIALMKAHLHPALALVFIVPFLPGPKRDAGLFVGEDKDGDGEADHGHGHSPLENFEHDLKLFVDMGLFFFAFANAGVALSGIGTMTWIILGSLVIGKTVGITACGLVAMKLGMPLPQGMGVRDLVMAGFIAALGLTVALFVSDAAFTDPDLLGQAKMGALFSGFVGLVAVLLGKMLGFGKRTA